MIRTSLLAFTLCLLPLGGCQGTQDSGTSTVSPGMVNTKCPQSGGALREGCPTSTWDGETIGFCCPGCKSNFDRKSDADKDAQLAAIIQAG